MANKKISFVVDITAQANNLNKVIDQSRKNLDKIAPGLTDAQYKQLGAQFDTLQKKITDMKNNLSSGLGSDAAFAKAGKDVRKFFEEYKTVIDKINSIGIDIDKIIPNTRAFNQLRTQYENTFEEIGKLSGKEFGRSFNKEQTKELQKAVKEGDKKRVQDITKQATNDLTGKNRSVIARATGIKKKYSLANTSIEEFDKYRQSVLDQYSSLTTNTEKAAFRKKYGAKDKEGILAAERKDIVSYNKYKTDKQDMQSASAQYQTQATEVQKLITAITELTTKMQTLAAPVQNEVKQGLDQLKLSEKEVEVQTERMGQEVVEAGEKFTQASTKAKSMSQIASYFNYWFSVGTILNKVSQAVTGALNDFKELDKQFNEISIVTGKTMDELWGRFSNLNSIAQEYGVAVQDVVSVQKLYYQQGRSAADVTQLTGETLKFAKISGLDFAEATDYMTASLNAYKIEAADASKITDTFAALSTEAAVDANEVAVAMSKVASLAAGAGSSFEDTSAYLSKIIETTREAPETAGTALKTIIARFTEIKDLTDEQRELLDEDFNFNNIDKALKTIGVSTKDSAGQMRGFSDILNDLGPIWENLSTNQKRYIATQAAGARQQSRFIALLDDWGRTQELQNIAAESSGTGAKQLALSMDSIESATNRLKSTWQEFYTNFLTSDMFKGLITSANTLLKILNELVDVPILGPGVIIGAIATMVALVKAAKGFGKSFGQSFNIARMAEDEKYKTYKKAKDTVDAMNNGTYEGTIEGKAHGWAEATEEEKAEALKNAKDKLDAAKSGMEEGTIEGKARALGNRIGEKFGKLVGNNKVKDFTQGMLHPFKTFKTGGDAYRAAQLGQLGKVAGPAKAGANVGLATLKAGGGVATQGAAGAAAGVGVAGAVVGGVAIAALLTTAIAYGVEKARQKAEKAVLEGATKVAERIEESTKKISDLSDNYLKALDLQAKGLLKTEEEMENYQQYLQNLKGMYPKLVKTLSDGTLELASNAQNVYDGMVNQERANIRQQGETLIGLTENSKIAQSSGLALTDEAKALQNSIVSAAANLSTLSKDQMDALGTEGFWGDSVTEKNLALMTEKGLNRQTLNEAMGNNIFYDINQSEYENLLKTLAGDKEGTYSKDSQEYRFLKVLAEQVGMSKEDFAKTLIEGSNGVAAAKSTATELGETYASEVGETMSDLVKDALKQIVEDKSGTNGENAKDAQDLAEEQAKAYYRAPKESRAEFEKYANRITKDLAYNKASKKITAEQLANEYGFTADAAELAAQLISKQQTELKNMINTQLAKYNEATGQNLKKLPDYMQEMSAEEIADVTGKIAEVSTRYGGDNAKNFEEQYKQFRDVVLTGNQKLREAFNNVDFFDNASIAEYGAQVAQLYGGTSAEYKQFLNVVNSSSKTLDRAIRDVGQLASAAKSDVTELKDSFETLSDALEGELSIEDMFDLIEKMPEAVDFTDFTAQNGGYVLSEEKILELREKMLELKIYEYQIEMAMNEATAKAAQDKINSYKFDNGETIDLEKILTLQEKMRENGTLTLDENKVLGKELEKISKAELNTELSKVSAQERSQLALKSIIEILKTINLEEDAHLKKLDRKISKFEKLLDLLGRIEEYSDIDAFMEELQLDLAHQEFELEFSTNVDNVVNTTKDKLDTMNNLISANMAKAQRATENTAVRRAALEDQFGQYVSFDADGNLLTNGAEITKWAEQIADLAGGNDSDKKKASYMEAQFESLLNQIDAYRQEKKLITESTNATEDLIKQVEEFTDSLRKNVVTLQDEFRELFIARDEEMLERLEERYDAMKEMDEEYLDSVREAVEKERQLRDQTNDYNDVAQMERRLELLRMGGGSATETQALEKEIQQKRQDLADQEQDNILDRIEEENGKRAEAMDEEVEYHKAVLDEKKENLILYNQEVEILLQKDKETIMNTWKSLNKEFLVSTEDNKILMEKEMESMIDSGLGAKKSLANDYIPSIETAYKKVKEAVDINNITLNTYIQTVSTKSGGVVNSINSIKDAYLNAATEAQKLLNIERDLNIERGNGSDYDPKPPEKESTIPSDGVITKSSKIKDIAYTTKGKYYQMEGSTAWYAEDSVVGNRTTDGDVSVSGPAFTYDTETSHGVGFAYEEIPLNGVTFGLSDAFGSAKSKVKFYNENGDLVDGGLLKNISGRDFSSQKIIGYKNMGNTNLYRLKKPMTVRDSSGKDHTTYWLNQTDLNQLLGNPTDTKLWQQYRLYNAYATGGLVNYTGPAWVDGTPTKPEAFLSARDTEIIAGLRDVLRMTFGNTNFGAATVQKSGDIYYEIHINVDELGDGYSVDDLMDEMEERIIKVAGNNAVIKIK